MRKTRVIIILFIFFVRFSFCLSAQNESQELSFEEHPRSLTQADIMTFVHCEPDSVKITYSIYYDKETSMPGELEPENFLISERSTLLTKKEIDKLNKTLMSEKSFIDQYAVLSHADITIQYYKNNSILKSMTISSITRNFTLIDDYPYQRQINTDFESFITSILKKKKIWNKETGFYTF